MKGYDTLDILAIGSSHTYNGVVPKILWNEQGYSAYVLGSGCLSPLYGYYYLVEALKYTKPKLVLFGCFTAAYDADRFGIKYPKMNLIGMLPSFNKVKAVNSWCVDDQIGTFWNFPIMHTRYADLECESFIHDGNKNMGHHKYKKLKVYDALYVKTPKEIKMEEPIIEESEWAIRSAIELCREKDIDILLINPATTLTKDKFVRRHNYVAKIASECGVSFLDGDLYYDEIGIDLKKDFGEADI